MLSVPRVEALALPIKVEQTTSEPTPIRYILLVNMVTVRIQYVPKGYNISLP